MRKFVRDLMTGPDGATYDAVRVAFVAAVGGFLGYAGAAVMQTHAFDPVAYGTGFGALVAGTGAAIGIKQIAKAEPPAPGDDK